MSRHVLKAEDNKTTFVGWDNPLQTFFAQTFKYFDSPEEELIWNIGEDYEAFSTPGKFVQRLEQEGFEVPYALYEQLKADFAERRELTPLQKHMKEMFEDFKKEYSNRWGDQE